jgi:hypothetical protein
MSKRKAAKAKGARTDARVAPEATEAPQQGRRSRPEMDHLGRLRYCSRNGQTTAAAGAPCLLRRSSMVG